MNKKDNTDIEQRLQPLKDTTLPEGLSSGSLFQRFSAEIDASGSGDDAGASSDKAAGNTVSWNRLKRPLAVAAAFAVVFTAYMAIQRAGLFDDLAGGSPKEMAVTGNAADNGLDTGLGDYDSSSYATAEAADESENYSVEAPETEESVEAFRSEYSGSESEANPTTGGSDGLTASEGGAKEANGELGAPLTTMSSGSGDGYVWQDTDLWFTSDADYTAYLPTGYTESASVTSYAELMRFLASSGVDADEYDMQIIYDFFRSGAENDTVVPLRCVYVGDTGFVVAVESFIPDPELNSGDQNSYTGDNLSVSHPVSAGISCFKAAVSNGECTFTAADGTAVTIG